jgi:hypothetical protein
MHERDNDPFAVSVRVATPADVGALAALRALWSGGGEPDFEPRMAAWLADEGDRRTSTRSYAEISRDCLTAKRRVTERQ